jgi:predicted GNAT superfamily acetyltransferase
MTIRPLHAIPELREVIALEQEIWGAAVPEDAVGVPMFVAALKRGAILLGAYDAGRLVGFVYSFPGLKDGQPMQWSHMLGVRPECRASGIGRELKLEQRRVALAMGLDLMEWTFDPLVAVNAHLNLRRLGVVVEEYALNVYGESVSPLHRGAPTDRFIAQWWMRSSRVQALLGGTALPAGADAVLDAPRLNEVERQGEWLACVDYDLGRVEPSLGVTIPARFTEMLSRQPEEARAWRMVSRAIFHTYLGRGYRVTDFSFEPGADRGTYLLEAGPVGTDPRTRPLA